ncbi:hypothetical protein [Halomonas sp. KO116]|uniref:hypothetical protein n=1 Tax=Halomonas sp. KO116 TaxID=1504981 RepID=UPI0004E30541|nr:hypothetical protein [Halomonas sp. KO116]AJY53295.1 hypothetical protein KO116_P200188 [Halomonas sp. KO116]
MDNQANRSLYGPDEVILARDSVDTDQFPLAVFQSFLYNQSADRQSISNAIVFWDWLPKYANEAANAEAKLPNAVESQFSYAGQRFDFTQFPGTCRDYSQRGEAWMRRYPGIKEQAVELALMKLASDIGGICEVDQGQRQYGVVFSIRQLRRELEAMGHTYNHRQIVESIDILTSSEFLLESANGKAVARSRIITEYQAATAKGNARHSPEAQWRVFFHRVVAKAIESAQYRQYDLTRLYARRSYGITLVKRLIFTTNLSSCTPLRVLFSELRETTSGLNYSRVTDGVSYLEKEIKRLQSDRTLASYEKRVIKQRSEGSGRPVVVDAEFLLYPSNELVAEIKASNARHMNVEKALMLSPRTRQERQMNLSLL